jgi:hypothetical protein
MDNNVIVVNRFYKGKQGARTKLSRHLKYLEHRPRNQENPESQEDRRLFDAEHDHVTRAQATEDLMSHRVTSVNYHALVLSPDPQEPVSDMREWTRQIMNDFAERKGLDLHWYAVQHTNTIDHPHVHVTLAGAGEDQEGKKRTVRVENDDFTFLRSSGFKWSDYELYRIIEEEHTRDMQERESEHTPDIDELFLDDLTFDL